MTATLTTLITRVQSQLIDDGTRFTTATCTAAIRSALSKINHRIPLNMDVILDAESDQYVYEVADAIYITDVLLYSADETHTPLEYDAFTEDNRAFFRLRAPQSSGQILARFTQAHTIIGLDSATDSTLTADQDQILTDGACAQALIIRTAYIIENNNLSQSAAVDYQKLAAPFTAAFESGIQFYERRSPAPSVGRTSAWNDSWHGWTA